MMADGALLLVDAAEGPLPQTRFVFRKCLERGFPVIVVINKIDRQDARPHEVASEVFDLFCDLEAADHQTDFPMLYAVGRQGIARRSLSDQKQDLEAAVRDDPRAHPAAGGRPRGPAPDRSSATSRTTTTSAASRSGASSRDAAHRGSRRADRRGRHSGPRRDQGALRLRGAEAHRNRGGIGRRGHRHRRARGRRHRRHDCVARRPRALPRIVVEEPTIKMRFGVNTSPLAGSSQDQSKFLTSRHLSERLEREALEPRVRVEPTDSARHLHGARPRRAPARRSSSRRCAAKATRCSSRNPEVVTREIDGELIEPVSSWSSTCPTTYVGVVTERLGRRRGRMIEDDKPRLRPRAARVPRPVPRPHRLPRRVPHLDARHRPAQHPVRRLGAMGRPDDAAAPPARSSPTAPASRRRTRCTTSSRAATSSSPRASRSTRA